MVLESIEVALIEIIVNLLALVVDSNQVLLEVERHHLYRELIQAQRRGHRDEGGLHGTL